MGGEPTFSAFFSLLPPKILNFPSLDHLVEDWVKARPSNVHVWSSLDHIVLAPAARVWCAW